MISRKIVTCIGLLLAMPCFAGDLTRISAFEYTISGQLKKEIIEPLRQSGEPGFNDPAYYAFCLVTEYDYDPYGNRKSSTTRNCNGSSSNEAPAPAPTDDAVITSRGSTGAFAAGSTTVGGTFSWSAGQFATTGFNALGHKDTREFDPRFGAVAKVTGPNLLDTTWIYDGFGRKNSETRADLTVTSWAYERCVDITQPPLCPSFGQYRIKATATGTPTASVYYDSLNRELRTETEGFDGTLVRKDTQYDGLGRVAQMSRPYYLNATPAWIKFSYDAVGRTTVLEEPAVNGVAKRTRMDYSGLVTTVTVGSAGTGTTTVSGTGMPGQATQVTVTTKNSQGQVIQVTRQ